MQELSALGDLDGRPTLRVLRGKESGNGLSDVSQLSIWGTVKKIVNDCRVEYTLSDANRM